jgi:hypothetical protein
VEMRVCRPAAAQRSSVDVMATMSDPAGHGGSVLIAADPDVLANASRSYLGPSLPRGWLAALESVNRLDRAGRPAYCLAMAMRRRSSGSMKWS